MKARVVTATEFKARCLALLDEVADQGKTITITKRGRPVAVLGPAKMAARKSPRGAWVGNVQVVRDIVNSETGELWDVLKTREEQP
jgi:prevent-host-death family protein